ncbi:MAG TPA: ATP-binding protein [Candidatus Limnocylindria bacterium]|nr:ATP-binding protein [Candidatus Limnocylindria bacterium]
MSPRLKVFVTFVCVVALGLVATNLPDRLESHWGHYVGWTVICLLSELLWLSTLSGESTVSMASSANLATLMLWGRGPAMAIAALSTLFANVFIQRKPPERAAFNASQSVITMWSVGAVWSLLGGSHEGLGVRGRLTLGETGAALIILEMLVLFVCYLLVNRALVGIAVAWSSERSYLKVLRQDWFYADRMLSDVALFFLCPLLVISFGAVGYTGLTLFYAPLYMIYESQKRYMELRRAQDTMIHRERMAAMGEMAAEIGHELRNQLVAISGRAQMLLKDSERGEFANTQRQAQIILEQSRRVETLSRGLMDSYRPELKIERLDVNALVQRSVEFVRSQNKFDTVEWDLKLAGTIPGLRADPAQLQQVLLNLFINAADAMGENANGRKRIAVHSEFDDRARRVRLVVTDTGPGIPAKDLLKIFEPSFTTKPEGHGFGLSTSYRIVMNHGGTIGAESPSGLGARFTMTLPLEGPGT